MDRHERIVAIAQTLPGIESFLKEVLGNEPLSSEADKQRLEFLRRLESISLPPSLPPRPPDLGLRRRLAQQQESSTGSHHDESAYKNEAFDPTDFASKQRHLARARTYSTKKDISDEGNYRVGETVATEVRDSTSSCEDDIYEHLACDTATSPQLADTDGKAEESSQWSSGGTPLRSSGGKGKLWFTKRETKIPTDIFISDLLNPSIRGYLKDVKTNKKRWCVIHNEHFYIFKTRDDPAMQIIDLPTCTIGVDDKKKISYSFKLTVAGSPPVSLAIEDGHDLSPWMSAIMAAAVRRGTGFRPTSPLETAVSLKLSQEKASFPSPRERKASEIEIEEEEEFAMESFYESPSDLVSELCNHSTPVQADHSAEDSKGYFAPLPPLPTESAELASSSDNSSDDEEEEKEEEGKTEKKKEKIYDEIPADLLKELVQEQKPVALRDSSSLGDDSQSEHSTPTSNRHSYVETLQSDDAGSSQGENSRKRSSTALSVGSVDSDGEAFKTTPDASFNKPLAPKVKRRRKQPPVCDARLQFFQDSTATYCGVLYHKRKLGVWSKRYCKIINNCLKCYRHPGDQQFCLDIPVVGHDFTLIDSKESKKNYAFKMSHPDKESLFFATNSRQAVGKWIEMLSLAATGGQNIVAPYPPYFTPTSLQARSRESISSEGAQSEGDSGDPPAVLPRDYPVDTGTQDSSTQQSVHMDEEPCNDTGCKNDEHDGKMAAHSKNVISSPSSSLERSNTSYSAAKDRVLKRRKEKQAAGNTGRETPSTMSPPHSLYIGENAEGGVHPEPNDEANAGPVYENLPKVSQDDSSVGKKDRSWVEALKKPGKLVRGYTSIGFETSKKYPNSVRKKGDQGFSHLLTLFDKEGKFCGYLTEVKAKKFSTTHVRRWCVVKNGSLHMYHGQSDEKAEASLSLVDMWLTDDSNAQKTKLAFSLHDKDGGVFLFQANGKEDFERWMGVLQVFTALRLERKASVEKEPLRKTDSSGAEEVEHYFERGTARSKSARFGNRVKEEGSPPSKPKASLRTKISQRVNVKDIFKKGHNFYDMENLPAEGNYINTVGYQSGTLTEVTDEVGLKGKTRWCAVKDKELLVYSDAKAPDPLRRFPLHRSFVENVSRPQSNWFWFQVRCGPDVIVLATQHQTDFERWLKMLLTNREDCNSIDENPTCAGRLAGQPVLGGILHKRTKSETLAQKIVSPPPAECYTPAGKHVSSVSMTTQAPDTTDVLISGYLQEMLGEARVSRWCVVTSEQFSVFDDKRASTARFVWPLVDITMKGGSADADGRSNFVLYCGNQVKRYQHKDHKLVAQWMSVFSRYCRPLADSARVMSAETLIEGRLQDNRKSASFNDVMMSPENERKEKEVLSEGRASGKKSVRKISEDTSLFKRLSRPDLFKAPWRASTEKLNVKLREKSTRRQKDEVDRRFSCGNLFDSAGRFCGHLMEVTASELCMSEVRRWCQLRDDDLYVYEHELAVRPRKLLPLVNSRVVNQCDFDKGVYKFRLECEGGKNVTLRALTRIDFEKWTTVISVKSAVLVDRSERVRRTRSMILEDTICVRSPSFDFSSLAEAEEPKQSNEVIRNPSLLTFPSVSSDDSVFFRLPDGDVTSPSDNHHVVTDQTSQDPVFVVAEEESAVEQCSASDETLENTASPAAEVTEHFGTVARIESIELEEVNSQTANDKNLEQVDRSESPTPSAADFKKDPEEPDRESLGIEEPDRGSLGIQEPDRESLGTEEPNRESLGTEEPDRGSLGKQEPDRGTLDTEEPDRGSLGESHLEELSALYENFVAFAAALNNWYQGEKESRAKQRAEALYENIPFAYEELLRERQANNQNGAASSLKNEASTDGAETSEESTTHNPVTVAWKFGKMHLQDSVVPSASFGPVSEAVGSSRPYSGIYGESELDELESEKDRSETPNSLNCEDAADKVGEHVPNDSSSILNKNQHEDQECAEDVTKVRRSQPSVDQSQDSEDQTAGRDNLSSATLVDASCNPSKFPLSVDDKSADQESGVAGSGTEFSRRGIDDDDRRPTTAKDFQESTEESTDQLKTGVTDYEKTQRLNSGAHDDEVNKGTDAEPAVNQSNSAVNQNSAPGPLDGEKSTITLTPSGEPLILSGDDGLEDDNHDTYFGAEEARTTKDPSNEGDLSTSQVDLLKAFNEILELHGEESGDEDTRF